jgi:hypothetical protein
MAGVVPAIHVFNFEMASSPAMTIECRLPRTHCLLPPGKTLGYAVGLRGVVSRKSGSSIRIESQAPPSRGSNEKIHYLK